jgi:molybdopterin molybdotransferase
MSSSSESHPTGCRRRSRRSIARDEAADILVTSGGASVGDHDLVQKALAIGPQALLLKVALRPIR